MYAMDGTNNVFFATANDTTTNSTYFLVYKGGVDTNSALMYMD